jgi:hypothetical protein
MNAKTLAGGHAEEILKMTTYARLRRIAEECDALRFIIDDRPTDSLKTVDAEDVISRLKRISGLANGLHPASCVNCDAIYDGNGLLCQSCIEASNRRLFGEAEVQR